MHKSTSIGIMDEAYFVPKKQILSWIYRVIKLDVPVIQDLGSGSVYCQLLDYAFGQRVPMNKVNWKAKFQYQFLHNLKVFQQSMQKIGISKKIDIEKLAKAKYQDNLQLIQWLKRYIQLNGMANEQYKPEQRRNQSTLYSITQAKKALGTSFKNNTSFTSNTNNSSIFLNSSICSTTSKMKQLTKNQKIQNKQNRYNQNSKSSQQLKKLTFKMNQIKKIVLSPQQAQTKLIDIKSVIFGLKYSTQQNVMQIDAQMVQSDQQVLVF